MKIVEWVGEGGQKSFEKLSREYTDWEILPREIQDEMEEALIKHCIEHKIKKSGEDHQYAPRGFPIIEYENEKYIFLTTMRHWGDIMARVWAKIDGKEYSPDIPSEDRKNVYCYVDFYMQVP